MSHTIFFHLSEYYPALQGLFNMCSFATLHWKSGKSFLIDIKRIFFIVEENVPSSFGKNPMIYETLTAATSALFFLHPLFPHQFYWFFLHPQYSAFSGIFISFPAWHSNLVQSWDGCKIEKRIHYRHISVGRYLKIF